MSTQCLFAASLWSDYKEGQLGWTERNETVWQIATSGRSSGACCIAWMLWSCRLLSLTITAFGRAGWQEWLFTFSESWPLCLEFDTLAACLRLGRRERRLSAQETPSFWWPCQDPTLWVCTWCECVWELPWPGLGPGGPKASLGGVQCYLPPPLTLTRPRSTKTRGPGHTQRSQGTGKCGGGMRGAAGLQRCHNQALSMSRTGERCGRWDGWGRAGPAWGPTQGAVWQFWHDGHRVPGTGGTHRPLPHVELGGGGPSAAGDAASGQPPGPGKARREAGGGKWVRFLCCGVGGGWSKPQALQLVSNILALCAVSC